MPLKQILVKLLIFYKLRKKALKLLFLKSKSLIGRFTFSYNLKNYLKSSEIRRLQLGSGDNNMEGWFNTDLFPKKGFAFLDASKPFNIPDSTFDRIFSEHMIEHISFQEAELQLKECYRILRSGSKIRIATPNLMHFVNLFNDSQGNQEYRKWISENWLMKGGINYQNPSFFINLVMHSWGHEFIYDFDTLNTLLRDIGFSEIKEFKCYESNDEFFKGIERHGDLIGNREMNNIETLVVEAYKE